MLTTVTKLRSFEDLTRPGPEAGRIGGYGCPMAGVNAATTSYTCAPCRRYTSSSWMRFFVNTYSYGMLGYLLLRMSCEPPMVFALCTQAAASLSACMKSVVWQDGLAAPVAPRAVTGGPRDSQVHLGLRRAPPGSPRAMPGASRAAPGAPRAMPGLMDLSFVCDGLSRALATSSSACWSCTCQC